MKVLSRLLILFMGLVSLFSGCTETITPDPVTYSQLLTGTQSKTWRLVSFEQVDEGQNSGVIPIQNVFSTCRTDDQYTFYADAEHKFQWSNGTSKCDNGEINSLDDTWTLVNANASVAFFVPFLGGGGKYIATIKNLTNNSLTIEYYLGDINASYRFTFNSTTK